MAQDKPLLLVDGSSYLFRAYHALPELTTSDGFPTGALRGVIGMLRKLGRDFEGSPIAVVFDASGKTFRDEMYSEYKANRPPMNPDLRQQIEPIHAVIKAMGLPLLVVKGVEADDVIGTLARQATEAKRPTVVSTSDKDMAQLVSDDVTLVNTMTETTLDRDGVVEKYGVPPELIIDYLALMGDSVDNIPGVAKVGPKTAAKWLNQYGSLDEVIARADEVKGKVGENLREALGQLPLSRELTTIRTDIELPVTIADLHPAEVDTEALLGLFEKYEFKAWMEELGAPAPPRIETEVATLASACAVDEWLDACRASGVFSFELVTTAGNYMDAAIVGVGMAAQRGRAAYIPLGHDYLDAPEQPDRTAVIDRMKSLCADPGVVKIAHNLKYAMNVLAQNGVEVEGPCYDTMLESYVLDSVGTRRHNLDDLAAKRLDAKPTKYEDIAGKGAKQLAAGQVPVEDCAPYAAARADFVLGLHELQWPQLESTPLLAQVFQDIELPLTRVLAKMERAGALVDAGLLAEQSAELAERMEALAAEAYSLAGEEFNLGSPKQLQEILYDKLALPILGKTQKGQPSTAEHVLQDLAFDYDLPRVILEHRSLSKLKSTYTDSLPHEINQRTGRIHTSYQQAVAATGRLSSTDPNLQNIPIRTAEGRRVRQAFVAPPGKQLLAADYSQIELRIMAHLSRDEGLLGAFEENLDVHRATASEVFGVAIDEVSEDQRRSSKAINFGLIYGMSSFGLARQIGVTRKVAQEYIDRYFARYPGVKDYMDRVRTDAHETGFVETVFGRRLYLPEINARNAPRRQAAERTAINAPMQGTAADIIKRAMISVDAWLTDGSLDATMIMQVHDELVLEVAESDIDAVRSGVVERMDNAARLSVELVVDVGVGANWDEAH